MIFSNDKLTKDELGELREMNRLIKQEQYKLMLVKKNTAFVQRSKQWVAQQEGIITVLSNAQAEFINTVAMRLGIQTGTPVSVDLQKGIMLKHDRPQGT